MAVVPFFDGITVLWVPPEELLEELLELLEDEDVVVQGGTINVVTLLLAGRTSVFWGICPELSWAA
ncbi:MAG: hypothetical protein NVSMB25_16290 [Thermoleophilaceae bacterium]